MVPLHITGGYHEPLHLRQMCECTAVHVLSSRFVSTVLFNVIIEEKQFHHQLSFLSSENFPSFLGYLSEFGPYGFPSYLALWDLCTASANW